MMEHLCRCQDEFQPSVFVDSESVLGHLGFRVPEFSQFLQICGIPAAVIMYYAQSVFFLPIFRVN